jgi:hypothetical protein
MPPSFPAPPMPDFAPERVATASFQLRYEDIAQDGRMMATALPPAIGWTVWRQLLADHPAASEMQRQGLVAILSRLTVEGSDESIRVDRRVDATGGYQVAHSSTGTAVVPGGSTTGPAKAGQPAQPAAPPVVDKLFLNMWVEVRGARGRVFPPEGPGPAVVAGRVFAEHTFTRLFAPPEQRRVTRLDIPGLPAVPDARYDFPLPATAMDLPDGAVALDDAYLPDDTVTAFGLDHTDSNQHVNSLVYPRLFLEAALRRLTLPRPALVRALDIAYRKPSFAGDRVRLHLRTFRLADRFGAAGFLVSADDPALRPRCCARILLG